MGDRLLVDWNAPALRYRGGCVASELAVIWVNQAENGLAPVSQSMHLPVFYGMVSRATIEKTVRGGQDDGVCSGFQLDGDGDPHDGHGLALGERLCLGR